jgi:hypothetical protein
MDISYVDIDAILENQTIEEYWTPKIEETGN